MTIEDLHNALHAANGVEGPSRIDATRSKRETAKSGKPSEPTTAVSSKGYQLQISPEGKNLSSIESDLRLISAGIQRLSDTQRDLEAVKQRFREGYYNTNEVIAKTTEKIASADPAETMLVLASIKKQVTRLAQNLPETDPTKLDRVEQRLREGFYRTPAGISALIDKILS
ncbi:MAG: hypothetical protein HY709_01255 [Candidatus Latescibacteria bacterium]|nr:hypothetical protein [Candidatus Latescibacterota bacterium]